MNVTQRRRREFIEGHLDVGGVAILEIGAANLPTYERCEADIAFLDVQPVEALRAQYAATRHRSAEGLPAIDFVTGGRPIEEVVDRRFGLVIANHVFEHLPDPIGWLDSIFRVTRDGAHAFLAIPDRRFTFDYLQRESDIVDLVAAREQRRTAPDFATKLRGAYLYRPIRSEHVWGRRLEGREEQRRFALREAVEFVRSGREKDADMHCHVFTLESFLALWHELVEARLVGWRLVAHRGVAEDDNEFHVLLERDAAGHDPEA